MRENRSKYSLDDLLSTKRSERPKPEFWVRFERELKAKQKTLIQRQLVNESRRNSSPSARFFKIGAFATSFGAAAFAVYLGFQAPVSETVVVEAQESQSDSAAAPSFTVAVAEQPEATRVAPKVGLKEFSTLAQPSAPRVVVSESVVVSATPTQTQLRAIETLTSLEETIRGNRARSRSSVPVYEFVSSSGLFETDLVQIEEQQEEQIDGVWDFESAYLLGNLADPLTGTLPPSRSISRINEIQHVSFSQLDEALSGSQVRRTNRSLDALTVRF